jgi:hypothetical protein
MKNYKIVSAITLMLIVLVSNSCSDLLNEKPKSDIIPSAFGTPTGLLGGITGVYNDIRNNWGTEGFTLNQMAGTDEYLSGGAASVNSMHSFTYNGITGADFGGGFGLYSDINALNGILEKAPATKELDPATLKVYLGQAQFLRAFIYFYLVQTYGNIPLHTTFITTPSQADAPAPAADIYNLIVQDLTDAITNLPNTPTAPFLGKAATVGVAKWLLSKVYLTRGWLTNSQTDFNLAYATATDLINNKGIYGFDLWQDYADAFKPANDYGKETIFVSDHSLDTKYGAYSQGASGGNGINVTPWMGLFNGPSLIGVNFVKGADETYSAPVLSPNVRDDTKKPDYFVVEDQNSPNKGKIISDGNGNPIPGFPSPSITVLNRDVQFGRPYTRIRPNMPRLKTGSNAGKSYLLDQAFLDRLNDSRYDKTFQTVWLANSGPGGGGGQLPMGTYSGNSVLSTRGTLIAGKDTAVWFPDHEVPGAPQFAGTRPFKGSIIPPSLQNSNIYPYMKKLADPSRASQNDPSTRPVVIARFSDVYLIAAEAAFKLGQLQNAADMINVVRQRAAYRSGVPYAAGGAFGTTTPATMVGDPYPAGVTAGSAKTAVTVIPAQITLDFILDERTREFYGESMRWQDLTRTQSLVSRVKAWNPVEAGPNIKDTHMFRPIPQDEINYVTVGQYPQNPGY